MSVCPAHPQFHKRNHHCWEPHHSPSQVTWPVGIKKSNRVGWWYFEAHVVLLEMKPSTAQGAVHQAQWPAHAILGLRRMEDSQLVGKPGGGEAEAGGGPCAPPQLPRRHKPAAQRTEELCPQLETGGPEPRQAGWGCSSTRSDTALPSANAVPWSVVGRPWRLSGEKKSACHCRKHRFNP